jgi:hypothetical protein
MNQARVILVAAFVFATPAIAQSQNPYNGKWTVSFDGKKSADLDGSVVIKDNGGTWDIVAQSRKNPCVGRPHAITVQKASAEELVFTVNRAQTLVGCKDSTYTFKKVDDKMMKGDVVDGREMSMIRSQ